MKDYLSKGLREEVLPMKIPVRSSVGCKIRIIQLACKRVSAVYNEEPEKE